MRKLIEGIEVERKKLIILSRIVKERLLCGEILA